MILKILYNNIQKKGMKSKTTTSKKKRHIIFQSYNDIKNVIEKGDKENININLLNTPNNSIKISCVKIERGQTPIISKNKKIIMFTENRYDKALERGKSPFFISDKISFRNEFKSSKLTNEVKPKHLGLCDFYSKHNQKKIIEEVEENDFSKTPRFHREIY